MLTHLLETREPNTLQTLITLALVQEARQQATMPGMLASHTAAQIEARLSEATSLLIAKDTAGRLRGAVVPAVWQVKRESMLRAFVAGCNGVTHQFILPDPQDGDLPDVLGALLEALTVFWQQHDTDADLLRWPSLETWMLPLIAGYGFQLDSICAVRNLDPFFATVPRVPGGLHVRLAQPSDAPALLRLFDTELLFHERSTPFVRSSPAVLQAFGRKLEHLWRGEPFEDGAPLIVVAEQDECLVAMAENTLVTIGEQDEPGFTPPGSYWCIDNVSVLEAFQRQGIGRVLVQTIESMRLTLSLGMKGYLLWYNPDNTTAEQFWSRLGFTPLWTTYQRRKVWEEV
jgi:GNAT superfamily N-acetyltransferase